MQPSTRSLAVAAALVAVLAGMAFVWYDGTIPSRSAQGHVAEIFRPAPEAAQPCRFATEPRPLMILALGQSNAGNHGGHLPGAAKARYFFDGRCYETSGPAPGATGRAGNLWTHLSPRISLAVARPVVFSVFAVEATTIRDWAEPGRLQRKLLDALENNRKHDFNPDLVLWQQGEADALKGTAKDDYRQSFDRLKTLLRSHGVTAPVIVALSTRCGNGGNDGSEPIRAALRESTSLDGTVRLGPDTDTLTGAFRSDGCHLSAAGLEAAALLWRQSIQSALPLPSRVGELLENSRFTAKNHSSGNQA